jgi:hypothetical protein
MDAGTLGLAFLAGVLSALSPCVLLAVEIDAEGDGVGEFRIGLEPVHDRLLGAAGRAPGRIDMDDDRLAGRLRGGEGVAGEGLLGGLRESERGKEGEGGKDGPA